MSYPVKRTDAAVKKWCEEGIWRFNLHRQEHTIRSFLLTERNATLDEVIGIVEDGGIGGTILVYEHDGMRFLREKHLLKVLRSLKAGEEKKQT